MSQFCFSCSVPLDVPDFKGPAEDYCKYCTDESGKLKSKEVIQQGIAEWLKSWQPGLDDKKAQKRAEYFMKSMPAWAEE